MEGSVELCVRVAVPWDAAVAVTAELVGRRDEEGDPYAVRLLVGCELAALTHVLAPVAQAWPGPQTLQAAPSVHVTPGLSQQTASAA